MNYLSISYINGQVVSTGAITGTLAATEAQDVAAAVGKLAHVGSLAATESQDTATLSGRLAHVGVLSVAEAQDTAAILARLAHIGTLSATDAQDIFQASGGGASAIYVPPALFIANVGRMMSR